MYVCVPALTLSAVEAMLVAKEALQRRRLDATNSGFTDDGLALGLTYILKARGAPRSLLPAL
jgi:WASH complex subunit 7, C-terminal